ncbi:MAG: alginate lyase family protein, partial [Myxococcales bacterium]|nr:alginate lyase family protein [Myxococcales bacterium]
VDYQAGSLDGMTADYCSDRPWNFALDAMWQTYGLINVADAYLLLTRNGYALDPADDAALRDWILRLAEAVNSSFNAWTKWADAHPNSGSYERYRADNHLSWCLAGLIAAAAALEDEQLAAYVLEGGSWTDSYEGAYANPSSIRSVIDWAIEPDGRIYEEKILRDPPIGYSFFHLWAMMLVARVAEVHFETGAPGLWEYPGDDGGDMEIAYDRYAGFVLGSKVSPEPDQEGDLAGNQWLYEAAVSRWGKAEHREVIDFGERNTWINQSIGAVPLLIGVDP